MLACIVGIVFYGGLCDVVFLSGRLGIYVYFCYLLFIVCYCFVVWLCLGFWVLFVLLVCMRWSRMYFCGVCFHCRRRLRVGYFRCRVGFLIAGVRVMYGFVGFGCIFFVGVFVVELFVWVWLFCVALLRWMF